MIQLAVGIIPSESELMIAFDPAVLQVRHVAVVPEQERTAAAGIAEIRKPRHHEKGNASLKRPCIGSGNLESIQSYWAVDIGGLREQMLPREADVAIENHIRTETVIAAEGDALHSYCCRSRLSSVPRSTIGRSELVR